jgi:hypothetical protein
METGPVLPTDYLKVGASTARSVQGLAEFKNFLAVGTFLQVDCFAV